MAEIQDILRSNASKLNVVFSGDQQMAAIGAMQDFALRYADKLLSEQNKSIKLEAIKLFPALWKGDFKLWLRKRAFLKSKKQAQTKADIEGRPFYVIRSTPIAYVVQSTLDARILRKKGIYAKNANSQKLIETADCVCYPLNKGSVGHGFTASEFVDEMEANRKVHPPVLKRK